MIVDANERPSTEMPIPDRLEELHAGEEILRQKALNLVTDDDRLTLHLAMVEHTMDICDLLRQFEADDEDLKVVQVFGMRIFSAFGAALKTCTTSGMSSPSRTMAIRRWAAKPIGSATPGYSSCSRR